MAQQFRLVKYVQNYLESRNMMIKGELKYQDCIVGYGVRSLRFRFFFKWNSNGMIWDVPC
jgi:hypothetical protein